MKTTPISGDMLVKLGIAAAAVGAVYFAWRKVSGAAGDAIDGIGQAASAAGGAILTGINPGNADNLVNKTVTAIGSAVVTSPDGAGKNADGSWTVGGWLFDVTHPGWQTAINAPVPPKVTPKAAPMIASQYDALGNYLGDW
jgi:hypothetical protein